MKKKILIILLQSFSFLINAQQQLSDVKVSEYFNSVSVDAYLISPTTKALSKPQNFTQSAMDISIAQIAHSANSFGSGAIQPIPIILTWSNPEHSYYIYFVENIETNPKLINLNNAGELIRVFRNEPTQDITTQINSRQFRYYGTHKITLYRVLSDYADLFKNNGACSQSLTTPTSDINNGLGIFTTINSATLFINVHKL